MEILICIALGLGYLLLMPKGSFEPESVEEANQRALLNAAAKGDRRAAKVLLRKNRGR
jgi:hypothetical protein